MGRIQFSERTMVRKALVALCRAVPCWLAVTAPVFCLVGGLLWQLLVTGSSWYQIQWRVALVMCCATLPVSMFDIGMHVRNMHNPPLQILVVRILWMVPFYSINSFLALRFTTISFFVTTVREMYEAFVLYSFVLFCFRFVALRQEELSPSPSTYASLHTNRPEPALSEPLLSAPIILVSSVTDEGQSSSLMNSEPGSAATTPYMHVPHEFSDEATILTVKRVLNTKPPLRHHIPLCWMRPWYMIGDCEFYTVCRRGVAQYVVWRVLASLLALALEMFDAYGEGQFVLTKGYLYITVVFNLSQCWALYCLIMVYEALAQELKPMRPFPKFMCVKIVVFFSWWQAFFLSGMVYVGVIPPKEHSGRDIAGDTQAFLICVEMFVISLLHHHVFPYNAAYLAVGLDHPHTLAHLSGASRVDDDTASVRAGLRAVLSVSDITTDAKALRSEYTHSIIAKGRSTNETLRSLKHSVTAPHTPDINRTSAVM